MVSLPREVCETVLALCEDLSTPRSLTVAILLRHGEWDQLASLRTDPRSSVSSDSYWRDAVATSILRKLPELPTSIDRKAVAVKNFWSSEHACFRTNQRLSPFVYGNAYAPEQEGIARFIRLVRKKIAEILGPCPDLLDGRFGPGATFGDRGRLTTVPDKMSSRPTLTRSAIHFLFPWIGTAWGKSCAVDRRDPEFVQGNRFTTVPKDCTKDRGIAVEPSINVFYQLAYGRAIRSRLLRAGIDLQNGQDIHRRVAREASLRGHLATLDLSNASDTVSSSLVKLLLPERWFDVLSSLRSSHTLIEGKWVYLEKFSSMGNGFTFELETLLFLAIASAAVESQNVTPLPGDNVLVYGDDIIVPSESAEGVSAALRFLGFSLNEEKSFTTGWFRESCGGDYFKGVDVRPFFLKELPREPHQLISFANGLRRLALSDGSYSHRNYTCRRAWFRVLDAIPSNIRRLRGPVGLGDIVIHDEPDRWQTSWRDSIRYLRCWKPVQKWTGWSHWKPDIVLASALYGVGDGERGVIPRNAVSGYKEGRVAWS